MSDLKDTFTHHNNANIKINHLSNDKNHSCKINAKFIEASKESSNHFAAVKKSLCHSYINFFLRIELYTLVYFSILFRLHAALCRVQEVFFLPEAN